MAGLMCAPDSLPSGETAIPVTIAPTIKPVVSSRSDAEGIASATGEPGARLSAAAESAPRTSTPVPPSSAIQISQWRPWSAGRWLGNTDFVANGSDNGPSPWGPEGPATSGGRVTDDTL